MLISKLLIWLVFLITFVGEPAVVSSESASARCWETIVEFDQTCYESWKQEHGFYVTELPPAKHALELPSLEIAAEAVTAQRVAELFTSGTVARDAGKLMVYQLTDTHKVLVINSESRLKRDFTRLIASKK